MVVESQPEFPTYPEAMKEPYRSRRFRCGETLYDTLEIPREDKIQRIMQVLKNFNFFGAPVGILITLDRSMAEPQCIDVGIMMQSLMLLAKESGLATCPQVSWSVWPKAVRSALDIDENEKVMAWIAMGYELTDQKINNLQQPRAELSDLVSLRGF